MRVALQVIAFNVDLWIYEMIHNAAPHVDKIFIAYPSRPWSYSPQMRASQLNPTRLDAHKIASCGADVEIVKGDWALDEDTRNDLLAKARFEGYDWMIVQDADEFYTLEGWGEINRHLSLYKDDASVDVLTSKWLNFWKSPDRVIINSDNSTLSENECMAIRASGSCVKFSYSRTVGSKSRLRTDIQCLHFGYVMPDSSMRLKISTWAHTSQVKKDQWFNYKWLNWRPGSRYLHPGNPCIWKTTKASSAALGLKFSDPNFLLKLSSASPVNRHKCFAIPDRLGEIQYDLFSLVTFFWRSFKSFLFVKLKLSNGR